LFVKSVTSWQMMWISNRVF